MPGSGGGGGGGGACAVGMADVMALGGVLVKIFLVVLEGCHTRMSMPSQVLA